MGEPAGGTRPMGEPALWGNPPYGGTRPQRGLTERLLRGGGTRPMGEPAPNAGY